MKDVFLLMRPQQWMKNVFIFLPLFFDRHLMEWMYWLPCLFAFLSFSFMASAIYCFNDIYDVEADRRHPEKCKRPLASGAVSKGTGYVIMASCGIISVCIAVFGNYPVIGAEYTLLGILAFYFFQNMAYCIKLKQKAIVDVFIIAVGFVLRVLAGGLVTGIFISHWIVLMTFLLALFLAFAKRRDDVVMYEETGVITRKNVNRYNVAFLNQAIAIVASITMVCYIMYTVSEQVVARMGSEYLYITSVFVLAGIIRYLQVTIVDVKSGNPIKVLMKDHFIQICIVAWILSFVFILYI